jgi:hypothetical protein
MSETTAETPREPAWAAGAGSLAGLCREVAPAAVTPAGREMDEPEPDYETVCGALRVALDAAEAPAGGRRTKGR